MGRPENAVDHVREIGEQAIKDNLEAITDGPANTNSPEKSNTTPGTTEPVEKPEPIQSNDQKKTA